jgi:hypothetical protein
MGRKPLYKGVKSLEHRLNNIAHILAYSFLHKPHPLYIPKQKAIPPPSEEVKILYPNSSIPSSPSEIIKRELNFEHLKQTICKDRK